MIYNLLKCGVNTVCLLLLSLQNGEVKKDTAMKQRICMYLLMALFVSGCAALSRQNADDTAAVHLLTEEYPPLNFIEGEKITGQAAEVVEELIKRSEMRADIRLVNWEEGYQAVLKNPDTALFSTSMTPQRKEHLQWVGPIAVLDTNLYALKGSGTDIKILDDAKRVGKIATVADYYTEQILKKEGFTNLERCPSEEAALQKLLQGEVDLFVTNNTAMPALLKKAGASINDVQSAFTVSTDMTYIAFSRSTPPDLVARWQEKLDEMKRDGTFAGIYAKWLPSETPPGILQLMSEEYPPVTFMKGGKPAGFVTDMVREIAWRTGSPDNIRVTFWKNAYNMAILHPNVVLFSVERTPEREKLFHWVGPVGKNSAILFAKKGSGIRIDTLEEARKIKAIATTTDWFSEQYLKREGFTNLVSSKDPADNIRQLMAGKVQLSVFTDLTAPEIVKNAGYSMDDLEPVYTLSQTYFYIAISKDTSPEVVEQWRRALKKIKEDGTFQKIYRSYLPHAKLDDLPKE